MAGLLACERYQWIQSERGARAARSTRARICGTQASAECLCLQTLCVNTAWSCTHKPVTSSDHSARAARNIYVTRRKVVTVSSSQFVCLFVCLLFLVRAYHILNYFEFAYLQRLTDL